MSQWELQSLWYNDGPETGSIEMVLQSNGHPAPLTTGTRLAYTAITRIPSGTKLDNARFVARTANYHEVAPIAEICADRQGRSRWTFRIPQLSHRPAHCTDGPSCAFLIHEDGQCEEVACAPLHPAQGLSQTDEDQPSAESPPSAETEKAPCLGLLPWPNHHTIIHWHETIPESFQLSDSALCDRLNGLLRRLFSVEQPLFRVEDGGHPLILSMPRSGHIIADEGYELRLEPHQISIVADQDTGHWYGLIALAQMALAARRQPDLFAFPAQGLIQDAPAYRWRGAHLDVSRQLYSKQALLDFVDILAWNRMSHFHWHLTDDEGWRLESLAYPRLTEVGAWRGHGLPLLPQHGSGPERYGGFFSRRDVEDVLDHAQALSIVVVPEIDVPGHCHAALMSVPELLDPSAMAGGVSVQGYVNNALNPGLAATWTFLETIFGEVCDLFPGPYVHIGGDEVAEAAWAGSCAAESWAKARGLCSPAGKPDSMQMQAAMLRFVQDRLTGAGKITMAWEEAAKGGGLVPEKAVMMAWMKPQSAPALAAQGYQVIMTPGQYCYLDMAQSDEWAEPGLSWAGTSSPLQSYRFSVRDDMVGFEQSLLGIQACIWSENLTSRSRFNHMVFPRLSAIAESGWTRGENKSWQCFAHRMALMPQMPNAPSNA